MPSTGCTGEHRVPSPSSQKPPERPTGLGIAEAAARALEEKKGQQISLLDVTDLSSVTDYYLIVSGSSPPHLKALFGSVQAALKKQGVRCYRKAGSPECGWLVIDYIDVIIHIFSARAREYYAIETLWAEAPRLSP